MQFIHSVFPEKWPLISERARFDTLSGQEIDTLWQDGWRHFGRNFFRESISMMDDRFMRITPLRLVIPEYSPSRSQKRKLKRAARFRCKWHAPRMEGAEKALFLKHRERFTKNIPDGLDTFLGWNLEEYPCSLMQLSIYDGEQLIAMSYLDLGEHGCSSVYACFDPDYSKYGLGIFTMLKEIEYARNNGYEFYYSGYASVESSSYDYKKEFSGLQSYDWQENWLPLEKRT